MSNYLEASAEQGKSFYQDFQKKSPIVLLNLLKFKLHADYSGFKNLKPATKLTGKEAYLLYMEKTRPLLKKLGSHIIYFGSSNDYLIGPVSEKWDAVLLVEHPSVAKFIEFSQSKDYQMIAGHRAAALEDSRLLPSSEF